MNPKVQKKLVQLLNEKYCYCPYHISDFFSCDLFIKGIRFPKKWTIPQGYSFRLEVCLHMQNLRFHEQFYIMPTMVKEHLKIWFCVRVRRLLENYFNIKGNYLIFIHMNEDIFLSPTYFRKIIAP